MFQLSDFNYHLERFDMRNLSIVFSSLIVSLLFVSSGMSMPITYGPTPYLSSADSPFSTSDFSGGYFYLEDFEDGLLNVPGATANFGQTFSGSVYTDSVDADDGMIDGLGNQGTSWWSGFGQPPTMVFSFDDGALGQFPNQAGIVWTDALGAADAIEVSLEAFDESGNSLGTIGPALLNDGNVAGTTIDDRFFGFFNASGISRIELTSTPGNYEVDHLQFGFGQLQAVPEPASLALWSILGTAGLGYIRSRRRKQAA